MTDSRAERTAVAARALYKQEDFLRSLDGLSD